MYRLKKMVGALAVMAFGITGSVAAQTAPVGALCNSLQLASIGVVDYGGTGISVAGSTCSSFGSILIAMSSTSRYESPAVTTDDDGTYFAQTGNSVGAPPGKTDVGFAKWDIDYSVTGADPMDVFLLLVDLNPAVGVATPSLGTTFFGNKADATNMGFLPAGFFDNTTPGEYTESLAYCAKDPTCASPLTLTRIDIEVANSVTATPEPATLALFATGLVGVVPIARRRNRKNGLKQAA